jgi:hypothetical protein
MTCLAVNFFIFRLLEITYEYIVDAMTEDVCFINHLKVTSVCHQSSASLIHQIQRSLCILWIFFLCTTNTCPIFSTLSKSKKLYRNTRRSKVVCRNKFNEIKAMILLKNKLGLEYKNRSHRVARKCFIKLRV